MRIPRSKAFEGLRSVVRHRTIEYTVTRPDISSSGRFGESAESTTQHTVSAWLFAPEEINVDTEYGDRLGGDLQGLALPVEDVSVHDRFTHGAETYEVERIMHLPDNDDKRLKMFALQKVVN